MRKQRARQLRYLFDEYHPNQLRHHRHVHQLKDLDDQGDLFQIAEQQGVHQLVGLEQKLAQNSKNDAHQAHIKKQHGDTQAVKQRPHTGENFFHFFPCSIANPLYGA